VTGIYTPNSVSSTAPFVIGLYKSYDPFVTDAPLTNLILYG
jgi:hypothetical protein